MARLVLLIAACVCFAVAVLVGVGAVHSNELAWIAGGLLAWALAALVASLAPYYPRAGTPAPPVG